MDAGLLQKLSEVSAEERAILSGQRQIDRSLYMDGSRDVISGDKLLSPGKLITIRPHTRFVAFPEPCVNTRGECHGPAGLSALHTQRRRP